MKERKDAQQAYINAMNKLKMPADIDLNKKIIVSGSSKVKMKSKALAYAALAAVLAVCIAVGAIVLHNRDSDSTPKIGSSRDMTLEKDDTIPSGLIMSVPQAIEQHQRCMLLLNDEYIKLKANRDNITKDTANSFIDRRTEIEARDKECLDYIEKHADSKQIVFVHAVMYDNGETSVTYRIGADLDDETFKALDEENNFWLCDAKTGEKIYRCVSLFAQDYGEKAGISEKIDTSKLSKLSGEISLVSESSKNANNSMTLIKSFKFFDKLFINTSMREELAKLALKASDKQDNSKYEKKQSYPLDVKLVSERADAHGIVVKLTAKPNSEQGAELIRKYGKVDENGMCGIFPDGEDKDFPQELSVVGSDGYCYSSADQHHFVSSSSTEKGSEYIDYICYIPLRKTPPEDLSFDIYLSTTSSDITDKDIENGITKRTNVGKITVKYKRNVAEKVYIAPSGKKIYLSDLYFTVHDYCENGSLTLKYSNGTQKTVSSSDLWLWELRKNKEDKDLFKQFISTTATDDDIRANFFKDEISTGDVTSVTYAGEEYTLNETGAYKSEQEAKQAFEQAYDGQLNILQKYKSEKDTLTADSVKQMCEEYDGYDKTLKNAGRQLAEFNGGKCLHAGKTTAGEIVFGMWYDESFPDGFTVAKECIISTDKDAKNVLFTGRTMYEFMASPQIALERNNYLTLISDNSGSDLTKLKTGQTYYITFNDENYKTNGKHITKEFTLTSDNPEMSMNDRYVTLLPQMRQFAYGSGTL